MLQAMPLFLNIPHVASTAYNPYLNNAWCCPDDEPYHPIAPE